MASRTFQQLKTSAPTEATSLTEAVSWLKENTRQNFDETLAIHVHLGIDPSKSDQTVRGTVTFPAGAIKQQKITVFTEDATQQKQATEAGATQAGGEELINQIKQTGTIEADVTIATPAIMPKVAPIARTLGPLGLMPNPKTGTVTDDPVSAIKDLMGGKTSFKMDQQGNLHLAVAKASWDQEKIEANITAFLSTLKELKPASTKGEFIKSITLTSTMSPGIKITA